MEATGYYKHTLQAIKTYSRLFRKCHHNTRIWKFDDTDKNTTSGSLFLSTHWHQNI